MDQALNPAIKAPAISNKPRTIQEYSAQESRVLLTVKSVFPFDPFPTTITIQPGTVSIVHDLFGLSQQVMTVNIADIFSVEIEAGLFFANLNLQQKQATLPVINIPYIWKDAAFQARRILQGLIIVETKKLEIPNMKKSEVLPYLEEIGSSHVSS